MKTYRKEMWFNMPTGHAFMNITSKVEVALRESGIQRGLVLVNPRQVSASGLSMMTSLACITI